MNEFKTIEATQKSVTGEKSLNIHKLTNKLLNNLYVKGEKSIETLTCTQTKQHEDMPNVSCVAQRASRGHQQKHTDSTEKSTPCLNADRQQKAK